MAISRRSMMLGTAAGGAAALTLAACGGDDGGAGAGGSDAGGGTGEPIYANTTEPENPLLPANTGEVGGGRIITMIFAGRSTTRPMAASRTTSRSRSSPRTTRTGPSRSVRA